MIIQIDTREKPKAIEQIVKEFDRRGVKHVRSKLLVGDYMNREKTNLIVDRKQNLLEIANNLGNDKERFEAELRLAKDCGVKLVILCEHGDGIRSLRDVINWKNPRLVKSPMALSGKRIFEVLSMYKGFYGIDVQFCDKSETGARILEILSDGTGTV